MNRIRALLRRRLEDWKERLGPERCAGRRHRRACSNGWAAIEDELIQSELTSPGDTLNYREQLFEKLSALTPVVASADTAPTKQSHQVHDKLAAQIDEQLAALDDLIEGDLAALNDRLAASDHPIVAP